jgi:flagellar M-ring protein FliF
MLEQVLGPGQAVVRVAVELNTETVNRTEEKFDPKGQVARSTTLTEEDNNSTTANNTQSPGMATNASVETNSNSAANSSTSTSTRTHRKTENNQFEVSRVTSNVIQNPGDLKRVSAAVFVAARPATGNATGRKPAARSPEELQKLKRIVQSALGLQLSDTAGRADEITLEEMPFTDWFAADAPAPESAPATKPVTPMPRWVLYSIVAGGAVALAGAFLWFRRRAAVPRLDVTIPAMAPAPVPVTEGNGHEEPDTITVEYLSRLMREQPHNVTQAVRGWLAEPDESKEDDES